jgi:hypothetical protein
MIKSYVDTSLFQSGYASKENQELIKSMEYTFITSWKCKEIINKLKGDREYEEFK